MKKLKTVIRLLGYGVLGLCALFAAGWLMFEPFGIDYHALDEKILYREKKR